MSADLSNKVIITVALTGDLTPKAKFPSVPVTPDEIAEDAAKCVQAGASVVHIHVRDKETDRSCSDMNQLRQVVPMVKDRCSGIINLSTAGSVITGSAINEESYDSRIAPVLELKPEMCSYDAGAFNWMSKAPFTFQNTPRFCEKLAQACLDSDCKPEFEIFNPGMFGVVKYYVDQGLLREPCHFQYILGVQGGLPAVPRSVFELENYRKEMFPNSTWSGMGISKGNLPCIYTCLALGGGVRVGLEDTSYYGKGVKATNEMLVARAARLVRELGKEPATPDEAREILNIRQ